MELLAGQFMQLDVLVESQLGFLREHVDALLRGDPLNRLLHQFVR